MQTKKGLACVFMVLLLACKKENAPLRSGTITYYHECDEKIVSVIDIPSAFTPTGDGVNDVYGPVLRGFTHEGFEMAIYTSAKKPVFITREMNVKWDGTSKGIESPSGAYFYSIKAVDTTGYAYFLSCGFQMLR